MRQHRKARRRSVDGQTTSRAAEQPRSERDSIPAPPIMLDEPASSVPGESLETEIAPTVLDHPAAGRSESVETDAAPSVIDQGTPSAAKPPDPETCSEPESDRITAEDLH